MAVPRRLPLVQQLVARSCRRELIPLLNLIHTLTDGTELNLGVKQAVRRPVKHPVLQKPALVLSRCVYIVNESDLVLHVALRQKWSGDGETGLRPSHCGASCSGPSSLLEI